MIYFPETTSPAALSCFVISTSQEDGSEFLHPGHGQDIAKAREEITTGKVHTLAQVKTELGL